MQSSYAIANGAALAKFNAAAMQITFENFRGLGGGAGLAQQFLRFIRCTFNESGFSISDAETKACMFEACAWNDWIKLHGVRIKQDGYGYIGDFGGCDHPLVEYVTGEDIRHLLTGSRTAADQFALTMPGGVTAATKANPCVISHAGHGLSTGNLVYYTGVVGMTQLNAGFYTVTKIDDNSYSIGVNSTGWGTYTSGGTVMCYIYPRSIGAHFSAIHGKNIISSPLDTHPGMDDVIVDSVTGNIVVGDIQPCVTLQGHDISIGAINLEGYDQAGILIQFFGRPADEKAAVYQIGAADLNCGGDGSDYVLSLENYDTSKGAMIVEIGLLNGISPSGIYLNSDTACGAIFAHIGVCQLTNTNGHSVYAYNETVDREIHLDIGLAQISNSTPDTNFHVLYAASSAYFAATGAQGTFNNVGAGRLERVHAGSYLNRALGGNINLGADVKATFTTNFKLTADGNVYRTSRAAAAA